MDTADEILHPALMDEIARRNAGSDFLQPRPEARRKLLIGVACQHDIEKIEIAHRAVSLTRPCGVAQPLDQAARVAYAALLRQDERFGDAKGRLAIQIMAGESGQHRAERAEPVAH